MGWVGPYPGGLGSAMGSWPAPPPPQTGSGTPPTSRGTH